MYLTFFVVDPYSPWSTHIDSFRINNINHRKFAVTANDHPYEVVVSTNAEKSHLVDMEVIDAVTQETIKTFSAVESRMDSDGLMVSSIDSKTLKSNVVLHNEDVVVFDEVNHCYLFTTKYLEQKKKLTPPLIFLVWSYYIQITYSRILISYRRRSRCGNCKDTYAL